MSLFGEFKTCSHGVRTWARSCLSAGVTCTARRWPRVSITISTLLPRLRLWPSSPVHGPLRNRYQAIADFVGRQPPTEAGDWAAAEALILVRWPALRRYRQAPQSLRRQPVVVTAGMALGGYGSLMIGRCGSLSICSQIATSLKLLASSRLATLSRPSPGPIAVFQDACWPACSEVKRRVRPLRDEAHLELFAFEFVGRLPKLARHLEDMVRYDHGKRGTSLFIPASNTRTTNFQGRVEDMEVRRKSFVRDHSTELDSWLLLD